jgi:hypothetical protein
MLEVEAVLLGFIVGEQNPLAAMVSVSVLPDVLEFEGPQRCCQRVETRVIVTRITGMLPK